MAGRVRSLRHRTAPVSDKASTVRHRALEVLLWGAVVLVGGYLLLPAAVDLVRTRQQEDREHEKADLAEDSLRDSQGKLEQLADDPQALDKIREAQELKARTEDRHE